MRLDSKILPNHRDCRKRRQYFSPRIDQRLSFAQSEIASGNVEKNRKHRQKCPLNAGFFLEFHGVERPVQNEIHIKAIWISVQNGRLIHLILTF
jgi:hypothetical protein